MPPRRIAFCITDLDAGGAERALVEIVSRLPKASWETSVFCLGPEAELARSLRERGIQVTCLGAKSVRDLGVIRTLTAKLVDFQPDILQTFLFHANVSGRIAAKQAKIPHVVSGLRVAEQQKRWHVWVDRMTGVARHHAICVSQGVADWARQSLKIPRNKLHIIPNGVDFEHFRTAQPMDLTNYGIGPEDKVIVGVGRLHPQKGFGSLIDAVLPSLQKFPELHLLIAGEGPQRATLARLVDERGGAGVSQRVHLPGRVEGISGLLKRASLYVLSSEWEGMPNSLLEAVAAGTPVIATNVEGVVDIIGHDDSPCIVNPKSTPELRQAIEHFLQNPGPVTQATRASQLFVGNTLAIETVVTMYHDFYLSLVSS